MMLSNKRITKALIRLRRCTGWSALLLFAHPQRQVFSRRGPNTILSIVRNLPDDEVRLVGREPGDPRGLDNPSPSLPNNVDTGNAG